MSHEGPQEEDETEEVEAAKHCVCYLQYVCIQGIGHNDHTAAAKGEHDFFRFPGVHSF